MFQNGQVVYHQGGKFSGKVVDQDGDRIYLKQSNGVEVDFLESELSVEPPVMAHSSVALGRIVRPDNLDRIPTED